MAQNVSSNGIQFRPDLLTADEGALAAAITGTRPGVIVSERELGVKALRHWRNAMPGDRVLLVRLESSPRAGTTPRLPSMHPAKPRRELPFGIPVLVCSHPRSHGDESALFSAIALAERFVQEQLVAADRASRSHLPAPAVGHQGIKETVLLVGAGVTNLVTAHHLMENGFQVTVVDACPDPRDKKPWHRYGASRGGGNARMFTLTEMDEYHAKSTTDTESNLVFDRPPARLGWDVRPDTAASAADQRWIREFKSVPPWLAHGYSRDILGLNRRSGELWRSWPKARPHLLDDVQLRHDILRLYESPQHLDAAALRQDAVGATLGRYGSPQVREEFPALRDAAPDAFAGGILVRGFTVNVHDFMDRLLDSLASGGADLRFGLRAERLLRDASDRVAGVSAADGVLSCDHYVVSPGVDGGSLLLDTPFAGQIHGVLGCWATIPNLEPALANSLKVARRGHITEDANVTVGRNASGEPVLMIGSGYGWTGADPGNIDERKLRSLHTAVADTVRRLFPRAYESIGGRAGLRRTQTYCVRPWTASNLGLFGTAPAANGSFVVTGGHNTGGFAQAPVIAEAVLDALRGRHHPMHTLYHPLRTRRALGADVAADTVTT
ncbi:FAD-dependent oxidoreductase [Streptomyces sp. NPDC001787]|uniref:NAD(P)/FAD-dependent oxidoreductase n=1 Tax=Streptomyces sp. NPDC001787 TaxID=3154523 RepID=UPI00331B6C0A